MKVFICSSIIGAVLLLGLADQDMAQACSANVDCHCMCEGRSQPNMEIGSVHVDGSCKSLVGCSKCCPNDDKRKRAAELCRERFKSECVAFCKKLDLEVWKYMADDSCDKKYHLFD